MSLLWKTKRRTDFRWVWFGEETYEAIRTTSTLSAPPRMPGMP